MALVCDECGSREKILIAGMMKTTVSFYGYEPKTVEAKAELCKSCAEELLDEMQEAIDDLKEE